MPRRICLLLIVSLLLPQVARADEAKARQLVEQSIAAQGGAEKIAKFPCATFKEKGTYYGQGEGLPYEGNYSVHLPSRFRMEIQGVFIMVFNEKQGWMKMNGETREMTAEEYAVQKGNLYHGYVASLLPLKEKEYKLSLFGDETVDGRAAVGVNVTREGKPIVTLFFDKENFLLLKSTTIVKSPEQGNKEVSEETFFRNYKDRNGIKSPTKMLIKRDGKKFVESEVLEETRLESLADSVFGKP